MMCLHPCLTVAQASMSAGGYLLNAVRNRCLNHIRDCEIHQRIANRYFLDNEEYDSERWPDDETIAPDLQPDTQ